MNEAAEIRARRGETKRRAFEGTTVDMQADLQLTDERLDQLIRWHGTDETNLPHPDTLKNLSRDTIAALRELMMAREKILELRMAMGHAFCATDFRQVHRILLEGLGPPPPLDDELALDQPEPLSAME